MDTLCTTISKATQTPNRYSIFKFIHIFVSIISFIYLVVCVRFFDRINFGLSPKLLRILFYDYECSHKRLLLETTKKRGTTLAQTEKIITKCKQKITHYLTRCWRVSVLFFSVIGSLCRNHCIR